MKQEKMHWFLVEQAPKLVEDNRFLFTDIKLLHQFNRVLKFKEGERLVLFNGKGTSWQCEIKSLKKRECLLEILEKKTREDKQKKLINLLFAIPKKSKFELIIEKGTEVGVSSFTPLITDRTEKLNIKMDRAEKILIESAEQSQNPILPPLHEPQELNNVIQNLNPKNTFVFHTNGQEPKVCDLPFFSEVNILIGPEGGWTEKELDKFKDKRFHIYKIGDSVLKTETACIVIPFLFTAN
jgi:16S rRNA (uracil1498-N3)-methyltransferase